MTTAVLVGIGIVLGLASGPLVHHLAVQAGNDGPFDDWRPPCRRCDTTRVSIVSQCGHCGLWPWREMLTSAVVAAANAAIALALPAGWVTVTFFGFVAISAALTISDIDHKRIPNRITYRAIPGAAVLLALAAVLDGTTERIPGMLLGALVYTAFFFFIYVIARGGFGFGDVKLALFLGLFLGYLGWNVLFVAAMWTALLGAVAAVAVLIARRATSSTEFPYGPSMVAGAWIAVIAGRQLVPLLL